MSIEVVKEYFKKYDMRDKILEFPVSSATVELAAVALGTEQARIAKTMSFKKDDGCILVITAGDVKIDNAKYRHTFGLKAKMLTAEEVVEYVGHAIGGVCPFAVKEGVHGIYIDESVKNCHSKTAFFADNRLQRRLLLWTKEIRRITDAPKWVINADTPRRRLHTKKHTAAGCQNRWKKPYPR